MNVLQIGILSALICFGMTFLYRWIGVLLSIWPLSWLVLILMGGQVPGADPSNAASGEQISLIQPYLSIFLILSGIVAGFIVHSRVTKKSQSDEEQE